MLTLKCSGEYEEDDETEQGQHEDNADAGAAEEAADDGASTAKGGLSQAKGAAQGIAGKTDALGKVGETLGGATKGAQGKVTETVDQGKEQAQGNGEGEEEEEGDEEDALPIGSVQQDGSVANEAGGIVGSLAQGDPKKLAGSVVDDVGDVLDNAGNVVGSAQPNADGAADGAGDIAGGASDALGGVTSKVGGVAGDATGKVGDVAGGILPGLNLPGPLDFGAGKDGDVKDGAGNVIGQLTDGDPTKLADGAVKDINNEGQLLGEDGSILGKVKLADLSKITDQLPILDLKGPLDFQKGGNVADSTGNVIGKLTEGDPKKLADQTIKGVNEKGDLLGEDGAVLGKVQLSDVDKLKEQVSEALPVLDLEGPLDFAKNGNVVDSAGHVIGKLTEGDPKKLARADVKGVNEQGELIGEDGSVLGKVELSDVDKLKDQVAEQLPVLDLEGPLDFKKDGTVADGKGYVLGKLVEGDAKKLKKADIQGVNEEGELIGEDGSVLGKIELDDVDELKGNLAGAESNVPDPKILQGKKVNKSGNVVDENGGVWGQVIEGDLKKLAGRTCDELGQIWNDSGKVIGRAEAFPDDEREVGGEAPFESFPGAKCHRNGDVVFEGQVVGKIVDGDLKNCEGKEVDKDGDISDKHGNTIGRAERYDEPEPEPEVKVDQSALAGKRVNKSGNIVDEKGSLFGKVVEGDVKKLVGKMCDKEGNIWNEAGEIIGRGEILPEAQREAKKEGPFASYEGCKVYKDGFVRSAQNEVIGKLIEGDPKKLAGYVVDEEGDVLDSQGNPLGKCERYDEPEEEKKHHPCAGYKVNGEGNVIDDSGDIIGKLTEGALESCKGIEIDDDGDISNQKGETIGHVTRIADCKPEKTQEEIDAEEAAKQAEEEAAADSKLTKQLAYTVDQGLEKVKPILKEITNVSLGQWRQKLATRTNTLFL